MNFGDFLDNNSCSGGSARIVADLPYNTTNNSAAAIISTAAMPAAVIAQPRLLSQPVFTSPGLSLALQTSMEGQGEAAKIGGNYESSNVGERRGRDEEHESRSGSENMDNGGSGDDHDGADDDKPARKKRYHRHTPQQIQELEALFKECPHPDEKQRLDLSRRLCLETRQVKFWFQNRRTQMKTQLERHENSLLRQENDKLRAENMSIREAMRNPMCSNCGGPSILGEISLEEQHLRIENARLKDELDRVCTVAGKFLGRPISSLAFPPIPNSALELGVGSNGFTNLNIVPPTLPIGPLDFLSHLPIMPPTKVTANSVSLDQPLERSMYLELALAAMDELVKMAQTNDPLWVRSHEGDREIFNHEEYVRSFTPCIGGKPNGFVKEASREIGMVIINSLALVETLMDSTKWAEMFPCIIARTTTSNMISSGVGGTRNGALHLMHAELQVVSPLVPIREVNFLRLCKQHSEGIWAVVDVSIDTIRETATGIPVYPSCRRLPSGCVVQDMPNGYSKIIWVEHTEYDESEIHELYRPFIAAGLGFGAPRWLATLQRQTECLAILMSSSLTTRDDAPAISAGGRRSMMKLAQRMTSNFCAGVCASTVHKWNKLHRENVSDNVRIMTRKSDDDPSEPPGIVLSAATSVWLPAPPQRLFDFLRNEHLRSEWDILSNGGPMQEMVHIAKGHDHTNCVSLLRANAMNPSQSSMLILQETCVDASGSLVVYAPVDVPAMQVVMNGGDSAYVALLPSGFAILPDGSSGNRRGSLLTVAYQILVNNLPSAKLTVESVETVNNLISCTVQKIRAAL